MRLREVFVVANALIYVMVPKPIKRISTLAEKVSAGDLSAEFTASGNDEIAGLARAFERMRRSLERSLSLLK